MNEEVFYGTDLIQCDVCLDTGREGARDGSRVICASCVSAAEDMDEELDELDALDEARNDPIR